MKCGGCGADAFIVFMLFLDAGYVFLVVGLMIETRAGLSWQAVLWTWQIQSP
jgi:hypothetical protein